MLEIVVFSTLNGVLYGMLLFMMASGLTLDLQHDGRAQLRPCQLLHARRLFRLRDRAALGFWPGSGRGAARSSAASARRSSDTGCAGVHRLGHVAELLFTFGLAFVIEELVEMVWGKLPVDYRVPPALDFAAFRLFDTTYPAYQDVHAADRHRDVRGADRGPEADARRPGHPGGADPSRHGRHARPRRAAHLHARVRRRRGARAASPA